MKTTGILGLLLWSALPATAAEPGPAMALPRSAPEAQGVASPDLIKFVAALDKTIEGMHGVVVVRHGQVILEGWWAPYAAQTPHSLYSLSKSFTSTAVGLAIAEGKLNLTDPVLKFFPEDAPAEPSKNLKAMRVSDLLRMSAGHQAESRLSMDSPTPWTKTFLAQPVPFKPGSHFLYNTPATYMASAIVQKVTGQTVLDYLRPRLFEPLGIANPTWGASPQGVSLGGYGLSIRTEDIAKFGQLYLQKGKWNGKQLVPDAWVEAATSMQTSNGSDPRSDWDQGYGYQFWRCTHGAFRGDGAFGQFCIVMPEQDAVVAINSGVKDLQALTNIVWDNLLPAFQPSPLAANPSAAAELKSKLDRLEIPPVAGVASNATSGAVLGKRFAFTSNPLKLESLSLGNTQVANNMAMKVDGKTYELNLAADAWTTGRAALGPLEAQPVAASGAWTGDDTFAARVVFVETPFLMNLRLKFAGGEVTLDAESNVGFGATKQPSLVGKAE